MEEGRPWLPLGSSQIARGVVVHSPRPKRQVLLPTGLCWSTPFSTGRRCSSIAAYCWFVRVGMRTMGDLEATFWSVLEGILALLSQINIADYSATLLFFMLLLTVRLTLGSAVAWGYDKAIKTARD